MTEIEALKLAARTAGLKLVEPHYTDAVCIEVVRGCRVVLPWNSFRSMDDAIDLACKMSADIFINQATVRVEVGDVKVKADIEGGNKRQAITHAITAAAVQIQLNKERK